MLVVEPIAFWNASSMLDLPTKLMWSGLYLNQPDHVTSDDVTM